MSRFLFTTLPTNDFGLLTRSLPIARELKLRGHNATFCHPAKGPQVLIREAGFENLLPASILALAEENVQAVISTGLRDLSRSFLPLPSHFRCYPFVPGLAVAKRSDLMINRGGYGSCQTGPYVGIPAVIIPTHSERKCTSPVQETQPVPEIHTCGINVPARRPAKLSGRSAKGLLKRHAACRAN
jgi:UDP:flavonoid glycosyltransferase YjiC (YdhE family)